ncbi:MAG: hypothetical protein JWO76_311 [Nocardioides sp.]|nr:hypothetical protein [Nocardioides sp.]
MHTRRANGSCVPVRRERRQGSQPTQPSSSTLERLRRNSIALSGVVGLIVESSELTRFLKPRPVVILGPRVPSPQAQPKVAARLGRHSGYSLLLKPFEVVGERDTSSEGDVGVAATRDLGNHTAHGRQEHPVKEQFSSRCRPAGQQPSNHAMVSRQRSGSHNRSQFRDGPLLGCTTLAYNDCGIDPPLDLTPRFLHVGLCPQHREGHGIQQVPLPEGLSGFRYVVLPHR